MSSSDQVIDPAFPAGGPDAASLRDAFVAQMRLVPGAVAIVACAVDGERGGLVATAWNSLSADPPMLLVCINRQASAHPLFLRARAFSINLLAADDAELVAMFSGRRGVGGDARFIDPAWRLGAMGQPVLDTAIASFECMLSGHHDYATHTILVGRVGGMRARSDGSAMLYLDGSFASAVPAA